MNHITISTREDLDGLAGTPEYDQFMAMLVGTMWRLERDDVAQEWRAVECSNGIERFGFMRSDFPDAIPPALPAYVPAAPKTKEERIKDGLRKVGATEEWQVQAAAAGLLALFIAQGKTEADAYADSPLYHKAKDVMEEIDAIRAEP